MKKILYFVALLIGLMLITAVPAYALTEAERDIYDHEYYPQSVNNGGINQAPNESEHNFTVDAATGNSTVHVTDITLPGKNGFDLEISRTYNSFQSNLYEPYVIEDKMYVSTPFYMVSGKKDFEKTNINNVMVDFGYNNPVCISKTYSNYKTDNAKYSNMSKFEFSADNYKKAYLFDNYNDAYALAQQLNSTSKDISATYPNASVGYYWANYKNCVVTTVYIDVAVPVYSTGLMPDTATERYSKLGAGWEFDFPYIEKRYGEDRYEYLHYGNKGTWEIDTSSSGGTNGLVGYNLNDMILTNDKTVSHDGKTSEYCVTEKNGKKSYFGDDGRLLLQRDRFGNEIKFYCDYEYYKDTRGQRRKYPYLIGITDSVGRNVTINYGSDYTSAGFTYKDITLTVKDPLNSSNKSTYIYRLQVMKGKSLDGNEQEYVLNKVTRPDGESSRYNYWQMEAPVNFFDRNTDFVYEYKSGKTEKNGNSYINKNNIEEITGVKNYYALLSAAYEPDDRECRFYYSRFLKNCTPTGSMLFYKAYYMCDDVRNDENDVQYEVNEHNYKYFINNDTEYDGYPNYKRTERIPDSFRIITNDIVGDIEGETDKLITNKHTYRYTGENDQKAILLDNTLSSSVDFKTSVNYSYDETTRLATEKITKNYDMDTPTEYMQFKETYSYDNASYGDLLSVTPNSDSERSISFEYNSLYHYPTKKTYRKNPEEIIVEEMTPTSDNLSVKTEKVYENNSLKKRTEFSYDAYGNVVEKKEYKNDTEYIRTGYNYTDTQYNGQYNGANLVGQTVYNVSDIDGNSNDTNVSYEYDWRGYPTKMIDADGNITMYEYDGIGRLVKTTFPDGNTETLVYEYGGNQITKTDAIGTEFIYYYDGSGNLEEESIGSWSNIIKEYEYDGFNNCIREITHSDSDNLKTVKYTYDTMQRPLTKEVYDNSNVLVYKETYSYTVTKDYRKETKTVEGTDNAPSIVTSTYYDRYGDIIKRETGSDAETYVTDYVGNIVTIKSARANSEGWNETHRSSYDFMGNSIKETDELGNFTRAEYDMLGRKIKEYDQNDYVAEYRYDNLDRLIEQKSPIEEENGVVYYAVKKMWYDGNGNLVKERINTNEAGAPEKYNEVEYTYDNRNRITMTKSYDGGKYNYAQNYYDAKGNVIRTYTGLSEPLVINGLDDVTTTGDEEYAVTKYEYDEFDRLLTTTDALGYTESNTYDYYSGNIKASTDRNGQSFIYAYDGLNNLTSKSLSDGTNAETTVYGATGQPVSKQNSNTTINYGYNEKGLLISETDTASGTIKSFTYDSNGNRLTFSLTRNGQAEMNQSYAYDKLNRLISVSENGAVIAAYSYDNKGNRIQTVSGGNTTNYTYNIANLLTSQATGDKLIEQYTYYLNGNQKTKTSNGILTTYEYDGMNRLSKENDTEYSFDDFGNRKSMTSGNTTTNYTYDLNNRLTKSIEKTGDETKTTSMFYDKNGNQVSKAVMTNKPFGENVTGDYTVSQNSDENVALYEYNCYNQLVGVDTNGIISSYTYAPDGMRASKTVAGNTTNYVYDNANVILEITTGGVNKYFRGLEIIKNDDDIYYFYNGQGDVSALADNAGNTVANYIFDAYGNQSEENTVYNPFGYRGEYTDSESGLVYLRARMYDPQTGRFINEDPARDNYNWYVYCDSNPNNRVDPYGTNWFTEFIRDVFDAQQQAEMAKYEAMDAMQKNIQRSFWQYGAQHLLREKWGYLTSAWMLEHSLQDNPSDIWRGNNSRIAYLVNHDSSYLSALDKKIKSSKNGKIDGDLEIEPFKTGDLYYSIHKSSIYVNGYKQKNGKWLVHAILTDTYDFTEIQSFMNDSNGWSTHAGIGTIANDAAVISQYLEAINPYKVTVDFYTTR